MHSLKTLSPFFKKHSLLLLILLIGICVRIIFYASISKDIISVSDSGTYLNAAKMLNKTFYVDAYRPPVYPLLILLSGIIFSWNKYYIGLIISQVLLSFAGTILIYRIAGIISEHKIIGIISALVVNLSIYAFGWDFMIMTECLSIFLVTLIAYLTITFFQNNRRLTLIWLVTALFLAVFTKPFFVFLPILILMIFIFGHFFVKNLDLKLYIKPILIGIILIYVSALAYSGVNYKINGFFGMSSVGNVNAFGKILQYHMETLGSDNDILEDIKSAYASAPADNLVGGNFLEPWRFISGYGWKIDNYKRIYDFSTSAVYREPFVYIRNSIKLTYKLIFMQNPFRDFIAIKNINISKNLFVITINKLVSAINYFDIFYLLIPLLFFDATAYIFLVFSAKFRRFVESTGSSRFYMFILAAILLYHYFMSAFFSYGDYCRLLSPACYIMYLVIIYYLISITILIKQYLMHLNKILRKSI